MSIADYILSCSSSSLHLFVETKLVKLYYSSRKKKEARKRERASRLCLLSIKYKWNDKKEKKIFTLPYIDVIFF